MLITIVSEASMVKVSVTELFAASSDNEQVSTESIAVQLSKEAGAVALSVRPLTVTVRPVASLALLLLTVIT